MNTKWFGKGFLWSTNHTPDADVMEVTVIEDREVLPLVEDKNGLRWRSCEPLHSTRTEASAWAASQLRKVMDKIEAKVKELEENA